MKNRLITLSDYVLEVLPDNLSDKYLNSQDLSYQVALRAGKVRVYTKFLKQNLSEPYYIDGVKCHPLNRFVPCDLDGNVLEKPINCGDCDSITKPLPKDCGNCHATDYVVIYQQAKDRCVFTHNMNVGFIKRKIHLCKTIEHLLLTDDKYWLTPTGAKMCGRG